MQKIWLKIVPSTKWFIFNSETLTFVECQIVNLLADKVIKQLGIECMSYNSYLKQFDCAVQLLDQLETGYYQSARAGTKKPVLAFVLIGVTDLPTYYKYQ